MNPCHHRIDGYADGAWRYVRPRDHHDLHSRITGGGNFRLGPTTTGVFRNQYVDVVIVDQGAIPRQCERPTIHNYGRIAESQWILWWIDKAQQECVPIQMREITQGLTPDRQKHAGGRGIFQPCHRRAAIGNVMPTITDLRDPRRTLQGHQRDMRHLRGSDGVRADPCGKGMGGVDDMADVIRAQVIGQPRRPAKSADARGDRLHTRIFDPPRIGQDRRYTRRMDTRGQGACFGRSPKDQDFRHG